jgi:hypothetical protein
MFDRSKNELLRSATCSNPVRHQQGHCSKYCQLLQRIWPDVRHTNDQIHVALGLSRHHKTCVLEETYWGRDRISLDTVQLSVEEHSQRGRRTVLDHDSYRKWGVKRPYILLIVGPCETQSTAIEFIEIFIIIANLTAFIRTV